MKDEREVLPMAPSTYAAMVEAEEEYRAALRRRRAARAAHRRANPTPRVPQRLRRPDQGTLGFGVLALLALHKEMTAKHLRDALNRELTSQVYPTLVRLRDGGWIRQHRPRWWSMTKEGRERWTSIG